MSANERTTAQLSRRQFLSRVTAGATALAPVPLVFARPLEARKDPRTPQPDYIVGELWEVHGRQIVVHAPGYTPELIRIEVPPGTQVCRRGCGTDLGVLRVGDRIEAGTYLTRGGSHAAQWVQANAVVGWGTVKELGDGVLVLDPMEDMSTIGRELLIEPYTKVFTRAEPDLGSHRALTLGDNVYFTGSGTETPKLTPTVWAYTVFKTSRGPS
jgi:hypothetical protein